MAEAQENLVWFAAHGEILSGVICNFQPFPQDPDYVEIVDDKGRKYNVTRDIVFKTESECRLANPELPSGKKGKRRKRG